jgi:SAM-dependent methyltransferase
MAKSPCGKTLVPFEQSGAPIVGRWADKEGALAACPDCGYLAFDPLPTEDTLADYYGSQYWEFAGGKAEAEAAYTKSDYYVAAADMIVETWATHGAGAPLRAHEIGCGYGATVNNLRKLGIEATGSDLSKSAVEIARALGNSHTETAPLKDYLALHRGDPINLFYMSHSLEHIPEMAATLADVHAKLPDGGLFVFRVPNGMHVTSRTRSMYEYTWLQYPDHIHYLTPRSALCLMERAGFEVVSLTTLPREEDPWMMLSAMLGRKWEELPDPSTLAHALAANWLLMEMQVIARKIREPRTSQALIDRAKAFEADIETMKAVSVVGAQNAAAFQPGGALDDGWRYLALRGGDEARLTPAPDRKGLVAPGGFRAHRTLVVVPQGQTMRIARALPAKGADAGVATIAYTIIQPRAAGAYEIVLRHNGRELRRTAHEGKRRYSQEAHVRARPGDTLSVDIHSIASTASAFHVHCSADWLRLADARP